MPDESLGGDTVEAGGPDATQSDYHEVAGSVVRSGLWSVAGQAVGFVAALVATPFTLRLLGPARYGLWSLLQTTQNWLGIADFGMTTASTRFAGERLAQGDADGEAVVTWSAVAITALATFVACAAVAAAAPFVTKSVLHARGELVGSGEIALRLVAASCVAGVLAGTFNTPAVVRMRWRTITLVSAGSSLAQIAGIPVALAVFGGGVITTTIVYLLVACLNAAVMVVIAVRFQPSIRRPRLSRRAAQQLLTYGAALTVSGVALIPLNTADRLLLGHFRGTTTIAYYGVASRLATLLTVIPLAVCQPLFPGFVSLQGAGKIEPLRALYRQALQGLFLLLTPSMLFLVFIAHPFLALWAGKIYGANSTSLFEIMVAGVWFNCASWLPAYYLSLDNTRLFAKIHLCEIVPYVALVAVLTVDFGATGAAIAWSARAVLESVVLFLAARYKGGVSVSPFSERTFRSMILPVLLALLLAGIQTQTVRLEVRAAYVVLLGMLYAIATWFGVLTERERHGLVALIPARRIVPSKLSLRKQV